jgi:hypothetical protein
VVAHAIIPATWEAKTGRSQVQDQSELHSETLSQKNKQKDMKFVLIYLTQNI